MSISNQEKSRLRRLRWKLAAVVVTFAVFTTLIFVHGLSGSVETSFSLLQKEPVSNNYTDDGNVKIEKQQSNQDNDVPIEISSKVYKEDGAHKFVQTSGEQNEPRNPVLSNSSSNSALGVDQLLVHIDLKGAPPKLEYLKWFIRLVARLGATGLLIEWEDKFPFKGVLAPVVAKNAYSDSQVEQILSLAQLNNLSVIPLIQTFGHMEFVLKLPQFQNLREDPTTPQAFCPSLNGSARLVETLIDQVMAFHKNTDYIHIGSDEVFVLGKCSRCQTKSKSRLILEHVTRTARYAKHHYGVRSIIWEDMLRNVDYSTFKQYNADKILEPMFWWYTPNVRRYVAPDVWRRAERLYQWVWGAGAYKGAFGSNLFVPLVDQHAQNNLEWLDLLIEEKSRMRNGGGVRGLVLTGWQRYDHFAQLCELIPAAIPSLVFSITALMYHSLGVESTERAFHFLGCSGFSIDSFHYLDFPYLFSSLSNCNFPGHEFYQFLNRYNHTISLVDKHFSQLEHHQQSAWLGPYNFRHNFSSVLKVSEETDNLNRDKQSLVYLMREAFYTISQVYHRETALEWLEQRIYSYLEKIDAWLSKLNYMGKFQTFPVRPLSNRPEQFIKYLDRNVDNWRQPS